eukprot:7389274-Prymnesium_polylepis.1
MWCYRPPLRAVAWPPALSMLMTTGAMQRQTKMAAARASEWAGRISAGVSQSELAGVRAGVRARGQGVSAGGSGTAAGKQRA